MNDDVRRFLTGLKGARDVNAHFREIERWVAEKIHDRLEGLIGALIPMVSNTKPDRWQFRSILDHLRRQLAMNPGRQNLALLLTQLVNEGLPTLQLRESSARFADAQEPDAIVAALEDYETRGELAEFFYVLAHEAVLRGKLDHSIPIAIRLAARIRQEEHLLARLPLRLSDLEADAPAFLTHYSTYGSGNASTSTSGGWKEDRPDVLARPEPSPTFRETSNPERVEGTVGSIRTWLDGSNGKFEVRFFEFEEPIPNQMISTSLLLSLELGCLSEVSEEAIKLKRLTASQGFSHLFSAAATGGAYTSGDGGAYGRLAAWQSMLALTGCSSVEIDLTSDHARRCSWFSFWAQGGWYYDVAWDLGLAVLSGDGKSVAVFAATDTD